MHHLKFKGNQIKNILCGYLAGTALGLVLNDIDWRYLFVTFVSLLHNLEIFIHNNQTQCSCNFLVCSKAAKKSALLYNRNVICHFLMKNWHKLMGHSDTPFYSSIYVGKYEGKKKGQPFQQLKLRDEDDSLYR